MTPKYQLTDEHVNSYIFSLGHSMLTTTAEINSYVAGIMGDAILCSPTHASFMRCLSQLRANADEAWLISFTHRAHLNKLMPPPIRGQRAAIRRVQKFVRECELQGLLDSTSPEMGDALNGAGK